MTNLESLLKAIETLSSANEIADRKLLEATWRVADWIEMHAPEGELLPNQLKVIRLKSSAGEETFLEHHGVLINARGGYLHQDFNVPTPYPSRSSCLLFAETIQNEFFQKFEQMLEERKATTEEALSALDSVKTDE